MMATPLFFHRCLTMHGLLRSMTLLAVISLLPLAPVHARPEDKPRLVPLFSNVERGPAFMLECENTSSIAVRAGDLLGRLGYRVDGVEPTNIGGFAGSFLGGEPRLQPMQTWRIVVTLRQDNHATMSPDFGVKPIRS